MNNLNNTNGNIEQRERIYTIALVGNPNVGKSTLFNTLTGMRRHTGNWTGKTLDCAMGYCRGKKNLRFVDLPGMYSYSSVNDSCMEEERAAAEFLTGDSADLVGVVCDAGALERNLVLVLQLMQQIRCPMVIVLNLQKEALSHGIQVDATALEKRIGIPVLSAEAHDKKQAGALAKRLEKIISQQAELPEKVNSDVLDAKGICSEVMIHQKQRTAREVRDERLDRFLTGKWSGLLAMLFLFGILLWITMVGANVISDGLSWGFNVMEEWIWRGVVGWLPLAASEFLIRGILRTVLWVVSVMLPPMAIFFPLFTILEDLGYLPRMAFNLDHTFCRCHACGKQALTMCMGVGCNAVGVTGCRIIESPRERKIALLTNSLMPCNGRLPTICTLISLFLVAGTGLLSGIQSALYLFLCLFLCIAITLLTSWFLSVTVLRGEHSSFVLELPPYRKPRWGQIMVRSLFDRTIRMLGRAVVVAIPAGAFLWILSHVTVEGVTLLSYLVSFLDGPGRLLGMDGVILTAFLLAFPANELVLPVMVMIYRMGSTMESVGAWEEVRALFYAHGWNQTTVVCVLLFLMFHWPCATTLWTLKKESGSFRWTLAGALIPLLWGALLCFIVSILSKAIYG